MASGYCCSWKQSTSSPSFEPEPGHHSVPDEQCDIALVTLQLQYLYSPMTFVVDDALKPVMKGVVVIHIARATKLVVRAHCALPLVASDVFVPATKTSHTWKTNSCHNIHIHPHTKQSLSPIPTSLHTCTYPQRHSYLHTDIQQSSMLTPSSFNPLFLCP